jgi:hypothetical protein
MRQKSSLMQRPQSIPGALTSDKLAYLYYLTLENTAVSGLVNSGPFINLTADDFWYRDIFPLECCASAWDFLTNNGAQGATSLDGGVHFAWAVMDGDVAAVENTIPEPAYMALLGSGLVGLRLLRRRRNT